MYKKIHSTFILEESYMYDATSNGTNVKVTEAGKSAVSTASVFNDGNQLTKFDNESLTYDANGNRTSDGKYTYTWNEADQLVAITKQGESTPFAKYKYDDDGRRIEKEVNGQVTRYIYDGDSINVLYEMDASENVLLQYVYGVDGVRVAMKSKGQTVYYHYNPHGDVIAMTDQDGKTVATYEYDAWGNVLKNEAAGIAAENPFGYAGYMYDKEISMYYLMARYYHPVHGVFISVDPDPGDEDDPITQNGYTYADNNPVMHVDPDGHWVWLAINTGFAAYDGYKAYKKHGWKAAAVEVGVGLVGGASFKAGKTIFKAAKSTSRYWYKGTFKNSVESLRYHHSKHVVAKGRSYSQERYTNLARSFNRSNKHLREKVVLSTGKKGYKIKKGKVGGYYTRSGKIVTFWHNGWKKKKQ